MSARFHAGAWALWLAAALVVVNAISNPLATAASAIALGAVAATLGESRHGRGMRTLFALALAFVVLRVVLFGLTGHTGATTLFTLPEAHLPRWLGGFSIGGRVTAEVVAQSGAEGLRLAAFIACFGVFLAVTDVYRVLRLLPRFLAEAGLVVTIALAFAPQILRSAAEVRDAQRLRGHRAGRLRGAAPLVVPVLAGALERAVTLAESMEARGWGRVAEGAQGAESRARGALLASLGALASGGALAAAARGPAGLGWSLLGAGAAGTIAALRALSRLVPRTRLDPERPGAYDTALGAASALLAAAALVATRRPDAHWYPYPRIEAPAFDPVLVLVAAGVAVPVLIEAVRIVRLDRASRVAVPRAVGERAERVPA